MGCKNCKKKVEEMTPERESKIMKQIWLGGIVFSGFAAYGFYTTIKQLWALII